MGHSSCRPDTESRSPGVGRFNDVNGPRAQNLPLFATGVKAADPRPPK